MPLCALSLASCRRKITMNMHCYRLLLATFALAATLAEPAAAKTPQSWTLVGRLDCQVDPNVGFSIVGHQSMRCLFPPDAHIPTEGEARAPSPPTPRFRPRATQVPSTPRVRTSAPVPVARWAGPCSRRSLDCLPDRSLENMSALPEMLPVAWVPVRTSSLAVTATPLRSRSFLCRGRPP